MTEQAVDVIVQMNGDDVLAGRLWSHRRRGSESSTFTYDDGFLARPGAYALDPALELRSGQQQTPAGRPIFGAFADCAPDRWGRRLIVRAEARRAQREGGAPRSFGEIDYLLGVRDDLRQGALRFRDPQSGAYLATEEAGVPMLLDLPQLLNAAERLERDEAGEDELRTLLRGGSSLGGSRPKAHVLDERGRLAIAKFPSNSLDEWDVTRWEAVALTLARAAGIDVPDWTLHLVDGKPVLVTDRFDRVGEQRIGYASAMTLLEAIDGDHGSYLEITDAIERESVEPRGDLEQLWRRIAFSILISNTDDHLRNHGFLRTGDVGWALSPAFDLNPDPAPGQKHLHTAIDFADTRASVDTLISVAGYFRLDHGRAVEILIQVGNAVERWSATAREIGLDRAAIEQMGPAFNHDQAARARQIIESTSTGPLR
jgi:serine/threonine-protein kinase HipA